MFSGIFNFPCRSYICNEKIETDLWSSLYYYSEDPELPKRFSRWVKVGISAKNIRLDAFRPHLTGNSDIFQEPWICIEGQYEWAPITIGGSLFALLLILLIGYLIYRG